jgi:DNA-binding transcriptional ArsR family regulator
MEKQTHLLAMLKTVADESRLLMLRLLNQREYSVGGLAQQVELSEPTVSHHLSKLHGAGLVTLRMAGNQRFYRINESGLTRLKQLVAEIEKMPPEPEQAVSDNSWIKALGWDAWDQRVLSDHTVNGRLTHLPTKQKKLLVILRWLATLFQADTLYTEPQVNAILKTVDIEDYMTMRRNLVDFGYLRRERGGGKYWLAPANEEIASSEMK